MTRSSRDPKLEDLASAVQQTRRARKRPRAAANAGPMLAVLVIALVAGASVLVFFVARNRTAPSTIDANPSAPGTVAQQAPVDVKPIQAVSVPRATQGDDQAVLVTIVSANVGPIELFPVAKPKTPPAPTTQSKLFGRIPEPEEQPRMSDPMLAIRVRVQNKSATAIDYKPWSSAAPVLADDARNVYAFYQFNTHVPRGRLKDATTIAPNEAVEDLLIFERPPATIRSLDLRLPGQNVGTPQPILISISPSQINGL